MYILFGDKIFAALRAWREAETNFDDDVEYPAELKLRIEAKAAEINRWVTTNLLHPLAQSDQDAIIEFVGACPVEGLAIGELHLTTREDMDKLLCYMDPSMASTGSTYLEFLAALNTACEIAQRAGTADIAVASEGAAELAKLKKLNEAHGADFLRIFGFTFPTEFVDLIRTRIAAVSTRKFESTRTELCTLAYPMHLLPKDNQAKSTMHHNSLSKLCQQMCRLAVVCLGEQDCKRSRAAWTPCACYAPSMSPGGYSSR